MDIIDTEDFMRKLAAGVDEAIKENFGEKGFLILLFEFGSPGVSNYVSNAERKTMIKSLRETADRLEKNEDIPAIQHRRKQ